jgi:mannose-6-phosphate isomerase-like protein (cupin superfamily)
MIRADAGTEIAIDVVADAIEEPWKPVEIAVVNDTSLRLVRLEGEFPWHHHDDEDELFLCWRGAFRIELEGRPACILEPGELFVVPAGLRHRPVADAGPAFACSSSAPRRSSTAKRERTNGRTTPHGDR